MLLNLLGTIIGFVCGAVLAFVLLFAGLFLISLFIEDQTALGWVWILYLLAVPFGAVLGGVLGFLHVGKFLQSLFA